jgi:AGCS family alanine or glycine:cation symporter
MNTLIQTFSLLWPVAAVAVGLLLSLRLGFPQFSKLYVAAKETLGAMRERSQGFGGQLTPVQSAMLGQAVVLGNGHVLGVMAAILVGGPGAVLWMWLAYVLGMATQFAEAILAVHFRHQYQDKSVSGGSFYSLHRGLGKQWKGLSWLYGLLLGVAVLGVGALVQSGLASSLLSQSLKVPSGLTALGLALLVGIASIGGVKGMARAAMVLVPLGLLLFLLALVPLLLVLAPKIPAALALIFGSALSLKAAAGGALGLGLGAIGAGLGQGVLNSTAGLGLTSVALAQAQVDHPVRQGFWGLILMLISLLASTLTALVFLASGLWQGGGGALEAANSLFQAHFLGTAVLGVLVLSLALCNLLGAVFVGEEGLVYALGEGLRIPYRVLFAALVFVGPLGGLQALISLSTLALGVVALINLGVLVALSPLALSLLHDFFNGEPWLPPEGTAKKSPKVKRRNKPEEPASDHELLEA